VRKSESAELERKKREFGLFCSPYNGNPVSEPKAEDGQRGIGRTGYEEQDWNNRAGRK
jgi:hypothetical protein